MVNGTREIPRPKGGQDSAYAKFKAFEYEKRKYYFLWKKRGKNKYKFRMLHTGN